MPSTLPNGCRARIENLTGRPELNGLESTVLSWRAERGRHAVRIVGSGEAILLRPQNLERAPTQIAGLPVVLLHMVFCHVRDARGIGYATAASRQFWLSRHCTWQACCVERWGLILSEALPATAAAEAALLRRHPRLPPLWRRYYQQRAIVHAWQRPLRRRRGWCEDLDGAETSWPDRGGIYSTALHSKHVALAGDKASKALSRAAHAEWRTLASNVYILKTEERDRDHVEVTCRIYSTCSPASADLDVSYHDQSRWDTYEHSQRGLIFRRVVPDIQDHFLSDDDLKWSRLFCALSDDTAKRAWDPDPEYWGVTAGDADVPAIGKDGFGACSPMHLYVAKNESVLAVQAELLRPQSHTSARLWWRFLLAASGMQVITETREPEGWLHQLIHQNTEGDEAHPPYLSEPVCVSSAVWSFPYCRRKTGIDGVWRYEVESGEEVGHPDYYREVAAPKGADEGAPKDEY